MLLCLRTFSPEFVVYRLSLIRTCTIAVSASLSRYNSTLASTSFLQELNSKPTIKWKGWLPGTRNFTTTVAMGSSISKGKKFSPSKVSASDPHASGNSKFSCAHSPNTQNTDYVEGVVCKVEDLKENEMKVFDLGSEGDRVLLVKQDGKISALGTKCTHYGAPLVNGYLGKGRIRCQWHGACFNILSGDIEDFPGMDGLPCYEVRIKEGKVSVRAEKHLLSSNKSIKPFISTVHPHKSVYLVIGGGPAGANCVETLRQQGYSGRLIFVLAEDYLPYDRIKLSKQLDVEFEKIALRKLDFYMERNVEILKNTKLTKLDPVINTAYFSNKSSIEFDKVFIATGSSPRVPDVPGNDFKNIFVLRTIRDAGAITSALTKSTKLVILGNSFIGMEAAAYCVDKVSSVTVVGRDVPFKTAFGPEVGQRILKLFEDKNVSFRLNNTVAKFEGINKILQTVVLKDGTKLPADVCIVGIGTVPNTSYLNSQDLNKDGSIDVNHFLQTKYPNIYAGGDIVTAPVFDQRAKIGHWGLAAYHGHIAAQNMAGSKKRLKAVPFFWTTLFGKSFRYTGYAKNFDDIIIDGNLDELKFIAFYIKGDFVVAVLTINKDPLAAKFAEQLYEGKKLNKDDVNHWMS